MISRLEIEVFPGLAPDAMQALRSAIEMRQIAAGQIVCHRGDEARALFIIEAGGVAVDLTAEGGIAPQRAYLGAGQLFGEMSLLSGQPVSATVTTVRDTLLAVLRKERFARLVEEHPSLMKSLSRLLIDRLRHRTNLSAVRATAPSILAIAPMDTPIDRFATLIVAAVARYAPASIVLVAMPNGEWSASDSKDAQASSPWPEELGQAPTAWRGVTGAPIESLCRVHCAAAWWSGAISNWRRTAYVGRYLVIIAAAAQATSILPEMGLGDAVLEPIETVRAATATDPGLADRGQYRIGTSRPHLGAEQSWYYLLPPRLLSDWPCMDAMSATSNPEVPAEFRELDRLARWLIHREIGIAMGAGAALGFAHLGVLQALQDSGIPIDYVCGASMGGAVALAFAMSGRAEEATRLARAIAGTNRKVVDLAWLPKSSILRGRMARRSIDASIGDLSFDQLELPVATVAADLVRWERYVFSHGAVALAMMATIAIPGLFPPVTHNNHVFVDGGLVSRLPVDLLFRRRCGLKIAVNVIPSMELSSEAAARRSEDLSRRIQRILGLRHVIGEAWQMLGWWHGAAEARAADIVIEPHTGAGAGFDFGAIDRIVEAGTSTTVENLPALKEAVAKMMRPGVP